MLNATTPANLALVPENTYIYSYNNLPENKKHQSGVSDNKDSEDKSMPTEGDLLWNALGDQNSDDKTLKSPEPDVKSEDEYEK